MLGTTTGSGVSAGGTSESTEGRGNNSAPVATVPFIRASQQHREPAGIDVTRTLTTSDQDLGVFEIPAYGYVRSVVILVTSASGTGTTLVATEDAPFCALKNVALTEPNGATLTAVSSGYSLAMINKYGGYHYANDPRQDPNFLASTATVFNFGFLTRIPVELNVRDALGSLPNQNSGATFKLRLTLAGSGQLIASGSITQQPTVRVRVYLEAWDQPEASTAGLANSVTPPAMNTTQFWTEQIYTPPAGDTTTRLNRVGNYVRELLFINRRTSGLSRANGESDFPARSTLYFDTRPLDIVDKELWRSQVYERYGFNGTLEAAGARDNGVFPYDFAHEFDGKVGNENRDLWLPTLSSTRLELQGNYGSASTLTCLTNDVAVAGTVFL